MAYYTQLFLNGVIAGSIYAMFAVGLTMIYGTFRFINFAHGELIAWGAYLALLFCRPPFAWPIYAAVLPALLITVAIGLAQDKYVYRPLRHGSRITLLIASIGVSFFLRNAIRLFWGSDLQTYGLPLFRGIAFAGLRITSAQVTMIAATVFFLAALYLILTRTMIGKSLRAVSDSMSLAQIMGIDIRRVSMFVWILASVFSGAGGILLAIDTNLEPMMGLINLIKAFAAVLLGGAGNVWGALLGGLFIGIAENMSVAFFSPGYKDFVSFTLIIVMLLFRPSGILGIAGGVR
jgi:branched-subunit amino acid ABC-type transport system permease component